MLKNALIKTIIRLQRKRTNYDRPIAIRSAAEKRARRYIRLPLQCMAWEIDAAGVKAEQVMWHGKNEGRAILYFHGGGYTVCSPRTHRHLVCNIARACGAVALVPEYRLAPEHPHPAAVDDAVKSYRWLLKSGIKPHRIAVMGDSAGGGLALALLMHLRDKKLPLPGCAVLLSPWTDLTGSGESIMKNKRKDPMLEPRALEKFARYYVPSGDLAHPSVSPLFGNFKKLPPLLFHVGECEILLDDARRAAEKAKESGVETEIAIWPGMIHVFHYLSPLLKEATKAIEDIGQFVRRHIPAT
ncbi:MAG: alpha/beta hydrolase [Spirochaetes bacterium]|nr:alpha/beta hydrolase [Spirochaetota bacterium]